MPTGGRQTTYPSDKSISSTTPYSKNPSKSNTSNRDSSDIGAPLQASTSSTFTSTASSKPKTSTPSTSQALDTAGRAWSPTPISKGLIPNITRTFPKMKRVSNGYSNSSRFPAVSPATSPRKPPVRFTKAANSATPSSTLTGRPSTIPI